MDNFGPAIKSATRSLDPGADATQCNLACPVNHDQVLAAGADSRLACGFDVSHHTGYPDCMAIRAAIINDTAGRGHFGCDLVMDRLRDGLNKVGIETAWTHPVGRDWRAESNAWLKRAADGVVVNGEGSIHHSATRDRARYLPAVGPFARDHMRVPAFLINATITEIDASVVSDLRAFRAIYVRDGGTQRELASCGIASKLVPDLTVGGDLECGGSRRGVCLTDSVIKEAAGALQTAASLNGWPMRTMHNREKPRWPWSRKPHYQDFARFLSSHELVITGRYHTVTFCIATGTPFVALESNTPKISWLLDDVFANRRRVVLPKELSRLRIEDYSMWTEAELVAVERAVATARTAAAAMFKEIRASLDLRRENHSY